MKSEDIVTPEAGRNTKEASAFIGLRYVSNALWVGGTALGVTLQRNYGVDPFIACTTLAGAVTGVEYAGTNLATKIFSGSLDGLEPEPTEDEVSGASTGTVKELSAGVYAAWAGAMSTVEINNTLGLPNTRRRRLAQSALYGAGVSLWSSQIPPFKQGQDALIEAAEAAINNPMEGAAAGVALSLGFFGVSRAVRGIRENWEARRAPKPESEPKPIDKKVGASVLGVLAYGAYLNKVNKH